MRIAVVFLSLLLVAGAARADALAIDDAWIRAAPPGADVLAGYLTLHNAGKDAITIVSARSADFERVELHEMSMQGGVMRMRKLSALSLAANSEARLAPGGTHLMLMVPKRALKVGDVVDVELVDASGRAHAAKLTVRNAD